MGGQAASWTRLYRTARQPDWASRKCTAASWRPRCRHRAEVTETISKTGHGRSTERHRAGPTVMVRANSTALPMEEDTSLPYASRGRRAAAARRRGLRCAQLQPRIQQLGELHADGAEEPSAWHADVRGPAARRTGRRAMLAQRPVHASASPTSHSALHTSPQPCGTVVLRGRGTSNSRRWRSLQGPRRPRLERPTRPLDLIVIAAKFITDVQTVVSRGEGSLRVRRGHVGAVHVRQRGNIIPDWAGGCSAHPQLKRVRAAVARRRAQHPPAALMAPEPEVTLQQGGCRG